MTSEPKPSVVSGTLVAKYTVGRLGCVMAALPSFDSPAQLKAGVSLLATALGGNAVARAKQFDAYYDANVAKVQARDSRCIAATTMMF